jgi:predicted ATP-grasp superfamily ATP-dependent carboligase
LASPEPIIPGTRRVVVAGFSTRAIAESAVRAGYAVASVDAFGDLDHRAAPAVALGRDLGLAYDPRTVARAARNVPGDAVSYVSSFENQPDAVALLARGRVLWGNSPAVLRRARDPNLVARLLRSHGFPTPEVRLRPPHSGIRSGIPRRGWLVKPRASGGGHGITPWRAKRPLRRAEYLQEHVRGVPGSVAFVADGRSAVLFACSRQLIGEPDFGASGFRYCGSILSGRTTATFAWAEALIEVGRRIAEMFARELHLVGINGFDFIARDGLPFVTEVNPRHSASMELAERAFGFSVFGAHAASFSGILPAFDLTAAQRDRSTDVIGKAVLFARHATTLGDTRGWLENDDVRDVPHPGERIARGNPVCTIFARGSREQDCHAALVRRAQRMYEEIGGSGRRSA